MRTTLLALLTLVLMGCPKQVDNTRVAGTDDEQLASYEARLEELRSRASTRDTSCEEGCTLTREMCVVAEDLCAVVGRHEDRPDLPSRCAKARESCAEGTDNCTRCRSR
jgi:hypothetical protein